MSVKLSVPAAVAKFCGALAFGAAVCGVCMGACAVIMAKQGLAASLVHPLAVFSACVGCMAGGWLYALLQKRRGLVCGLTLGAVFAVILLLVQGFSGSTPDQAQIARLALIALAGAVGGLLRALRPLKRRQKR